MLKRFLISGCIVLFREHRSLQSVLPLTILLASVGLTMLVRPFCTPIFDRRRFALAVATSLCADNPLLSAALILAEVRRSTSPA